MPQFIKVIIATSVALLTLQSGSVLAEATKKKSSSTKNAVKTLQNGNTPSDNSVSPKAIGSPGLIVTPQDAAVITPIGQDGGSTGGGSGGTDTTSTETTGTEGGSTGGGSGGTDTTSTETTGTEGGSTGGGSGGTEEPIPEPPVSVQ